MGQRAVLDATADRLPAMLAYWDTRLRCRFANRAFETWFGGRAGTIVGRHLAEVLGPLHALDLPYIEGALRGELHELEREIPDPGGGPARRGRVHYVPDVRDGSVRGFTVLLLPTSGRDRRADVAARMALENRLRLLVADDNAAVLRTLERLLERDHDVTAVASGRDALTALLAPGSAFDLVLCELVMAELSGAEVYREVQRCRPELARRFMFLTGGALTAQGRELLRSTDVPVLEKPFEMAEIRVALAARVAALSELAERGE
jgi:CheY-like chemotaxis protein